MIKALIIEDELIQLAYLQNLLADFCPEIQVVGSIHSAADVVKTISDCSFEILFLDVLLQGVNSIELLEQLPKIEFQIIFFSAFEQYALKAIKMQAVDYLVKPFNGRELQIAVNNAIERINQKESHSYRSIKVSSSNDKILCISEYDSLNFIPCHNILFCRSDGNYTHINFTNETGISEKILATKTLSHFEQKLCFPNFIRIHQSILVNKTKIRKIRKGSRELVLIDGTVLEIARNRKSAVLSLLQQ